MPYKIARYGWVRDLPDQRDHLYAAAPATLTALPSQTDLRPQCPPVYDQGQIGSCTANAIAGAHEFVQQKEKLGPPSPFGPSRLFIYYNERALEGTVNSDSGAQIREGIKSIAQQGVCREDPTWPYDGDPFPPNNKLTQKASPAAYTEAAKYTAVQYQRVPQVLTQMKGCLASGYPFVFGFTVYQSFESKQVDWHRANATAGGTSAWWPRGAGSGLRRRAAALHPKFLGTRVGHPGLLHDALPLLIRWVARQRFLDGSSREVTAVGGSLIRAGGTVAGD